MFFSLINNQSFIRNNNKAAIKINYFISNRNNFFIILDYNTFKNQTKLVYHNRIKRKDQKNLIKLKYSTKREYDNPKRKLKIEK